MGVLEFLMTLLGTVFTVVAFIRSEKGRRIRQRPFLTYREVPPDRPLDPDILFAMQGKDLQWWPEWEIDRAKQSGWSIAEVAKQQLVTKPRDTQLFLMYRPLAGGGHD